MLKDSINIENVEQIKITEDIKLPGTDIVLEPGDKILYKASETINIEKRYRLTIITNGRSNWFSICRTDIDSGKDTYLRISFEKGEVYRWVTDRMQASVYNSKEQAENIIRKLELKFDH